MGDLKESVSFLKDNCAMSNGSITPSEICVVPDIEPVLDMSSTKNYPENESGFIDISSSSNLTPVSSKMTNSNPSPVVDTSTNDFSPNLEADSGIIESESYINDDTLCALEDKERNFDEHSGIMTFDFIEGENDAKFQDNEFRDATDVFKDTDALKFLENVGSSPFSKSLLSRDSLYEKFDPFYAKCSEFDIRLSMLQTSVEDEAECEQDELRSTENTESLEKTKDKFNNVASNNFSDDVYRNTNDCQLEETNIIQSNLCKSCLRQSIGNSLISFDTPIIEITSTSIENTEVSEFQKTYTERELQQALKLQELQLQESFLKKQKKMEDAFLRKKQELEVKFEHQNSVFHTLYATFKEVMDLVHNLLHKQEKLEEELQISEKSKKQLEKDMNKFVENLENIENKFSDFHKEYEQSKTMLLLYIKNDSLMQQLENVNMQLLKKEKMYKELKSISEGILAKRNTEVPPSKSSDNIKVVESNNNEA